MKYEINVGGGFTGIPKKYEGIIDDADGKKPILISTLKNCASTTMNDEVRDGLVFRIKLIDDGTEYGAIYDDTNLPTSLREFISGLS